MEIIFEKPKTEQFFQADIYKTLEKRQIYGGTLEKEIYVVVVGAEGTEIPPTKGKFRDYYAISNFMNLQSIDKWIEEQVKELKKKGKIVEIDGTFSYMMAKALEELVRDSPVVV